MTGNITGIIGLIRDVTERLLAEETLKEKLNELEKFNKVMVGRENKMIELKKEINELCAKLDIPKKYNLPEEVEVK
ncbi:MAG: hypothetical protein U5K00_00125 [Melioribacteraceae bacterium]|nr:hypothetical protein [Melioribacteraceae bacterium]